MYGGRTLPRPAAQLALPAPELELPAPASDAQQDRPVDAAPPPVKAVVPEVETAGFKSKSVEQMAADMAEVLGKTTSEAAAGILLKLNV